MEYPAQRKQTKDSSLSVRPSETLRRYTALTSLSNGLVENWVEIVKLLFKTALESSSGPYLALLNYTLLKHGQWQGFTYKKEEKALSKWQVWPYDNSRVRTRQTRHYDRLAGATRSLMLFTTPLLSQQEAWDELAPQMISNDLTLAHLLLLSSSLEP